MMEVVSTVGLMSSFTFDTAHTVSSLFDGSISNNATVLMMLSAGSMMADAHNLAVYLYCIVLYCSQDDIVVCSQLMKPFALCRLFE